MDYQTEQLVEAVLNSGQPHALLSAPLRELVRKVHEFDCSGMRVLILGGGTGLSTIVGGNSRLAGWPSNPNVGLKRLFPQLDVIVCTTDDGGSTGELLKLLPMIGIGDLRKLCLSMIDPDRLAARYGLDASRTDTLIRLIHCVFNHRFPKGTSDGRAAADPIQVASSPLSEACPKELDDLLRSLGEFLTPDGRGPMVPPGGQCLGNLLLTAAIFSEAGGDFRHPPAMDIVIKGIDRIARAIGARPGHLYPATAAPGQLVFRYANGVEVHGQSKSATSRRGFPVERAYSEFCLPPAVAPDILRKVREADLIILAPGSLYTSSIPALQVPGLATAIRENHRALKVLGANLWVEEGETDIAHRDKARGFLVSELLEAYGHNVPGGYAGLFHFALTANLQHISGTILRNYALEGKRPIYLDRANVEAMGVQPVESTIFSTKPLNDSGFIHHDPTRFALAVRTLLFVWQQKRESGGEIAFPLSKAIPHQHHHQGEMPLCDYWRGIVDALAGKKFSSRHLHQTVLDLAWRNRDIRIGHFDFIEEVRIVPASEWKRSNEWDSVMGYYDPQDRTIKIHSQVLDAPLLLQGNVLIALGESLLGCYIKERIWLDADGIGKLGARCYQIVLLPPDQRECFLPPTQLHEYLTLARMVQHPENSDIYSITLNGNEGFLPPGLLFGLMYAWYLDNACVPIMENEMAILHCREATLIPHQAHEYRRKKALIDFFRNEVFGYARAGTDLKG